MELRSASPKKDEEGRDALGHDETLKVELGLEDVVEEAVILASVGSWEQEQDLVLETEEK